MSILLTARVGHSESHPPQRCRYGLELFARGRRRRLIQVTRPILHKPPSKFEQVGSAVRCLDPVLCQNSALLK